MTWAQSLEARKPSVREQYEELVRQAKPYAQVEIDRMKARGDKLSNEPKWRRNIQAAIASTAMQRGETVEAVARRHGLIESPQQERPVAVDPVKVAA
jgi:hypothetical protein